MYIQNASQALNPAVQQTGSAAQNGSSGNSSDSVIKGIQSQIDHVHDQMQSLSADKELTLEEKMERRKELQDELSGLKNQLMQRNMQIQQEKLEKKNREIEKNAADQAAKETKGQDQNAGSGSAAQPSGSLDTFEMKGLISADSSMSQAQTAESVRSSLQGQANVLEGEIRLDAARGDSTAAKSGSLAILNSKISGIASANAGRLGGINEKVTDPVESADAPDAPAPAEDPKDVKKADGEKKDAGSADGKTGTDNGSTADEVSKISVASDLTLYRSVDILA